MVSYEFSLLTEGSGASEIESVQRAKLGAVGLQLIPCILLPRKPTNFVSILFNGFKEFKVH